MKEFKGTPAPWSLPHFADDNCTCDCGFVLVEGHCGAVATVHYSKDNSVNNGDNPPPEQCIANAKLIAAAPELLKELMDIRSEIKHAGDDFEFTKEDIDRVDKLLNKALGI